MHLYLLDGHSIVYRYHHAFAKNPLITSKGVNTSATWGMAKIVTTLLLHYPVTHIGVIFDPPYRTWRKDFYPEYKANRKHADDITPQLEMSYHLLKTWGIYTAAFRPLEADDVIGILAKKSETKGKVTIVSKDKDLAQLVNESTTMLDLGKSVGNDEATILDRQGIYNKFGVYPEQIVDYLTILGDTSDNVPGITGVGKKGAINLLSEYGSLDNIYNNLIKLTKTKRKKFEDAQKHIERDRTLITLATNCNINVDIDQLKKPPVHSTDLFELLEELECYSIIKEISKNSE
jgi:DNA polymerase-1